ncbi:MAG: PP2C family protein-serine/threonine phosphatase [Clostridia bacterium]|nr:PP2C family protein-serine/threonine phosphatase [Clostridia bacterium]
MKRIFAMLNARESSLPKSSLLRLNEERANHYTALCLRIAAVIALLMWILNMVGFFIVDRTMMNLAMPTGIVLLLLPSVLERGRLIGKPYTKYLMMCCFLLGVTLMSATLTFHMIIAWTCPIILSCHFYSPRFTRFTTVGTLLLMMLSLYAGLYIGVWDANMMRSAIQVNEPSLRVEYINSLYAEGDNLILRCFNFYYLPRAAILIVVYLICLTLSKRTHSLLIQQDTITRESERITTELNVATEIQTSMLPCNFPAFPERPEFDIYALMEPAKEVGGDFYDFFMVDDTHLAIVVADVSGKGVPAALFMVIGKTLIKDHTCPGCDLGNVFSTVNNILCESNSENMFITAFEGVLDLVTGEFNYVNAGHETPFIARSGEPFRPEKVRPGFVLAGMDGINYKAGTLTLNPGDKIFQYSDGVPEAHNACNQLYGMKRLEDVLGKLSTLPPVELLTAVKRDIEVYAGDTPQFDDITMLCLEYKARMKKR